MWVLDSKTQDFQNQYKITSKITQFIGNGNIELFSSSFFNKIALINNNIITEKYNFIQSEMLSFIPLSTHKNLKKVLILGGYNIEIAFQLQKYGVNIDIIIDDIEILNVLNGFFPNFKIIMDNPHINIKKTLNEVNNEKYDLIIHLGNIQAHEFMLLNRLTNSQHILIFKLPHLYLESSKAMQTLKDAYTLSKILMPFSFCSGIENQYFAYSSDKFHPIADLKLQISDMLEGLFFYNSKIHEASFYLSNDIKLLFNKFIKI